MLRFKISDFSQIQPLIVTAFLIHKKKRRMFQSIFYAKYKGTKIINKVYGQG